MDHGELVIREAVLDDLPVLLEFEQEIIAVERPFDPTIRDGHVNYYDLREYIEADYACVYVAEYDNSLVSSGYALRKKARSYLDHDEYAHLGFMYTVPDYRGLGINQLIIQALQGWAKQKKLSEIRLTVYQENIGAIKAYEKVGMDKHIIQMRMRIK